MNRNKKLLMLVGIVLLVFSFGAIAATRPVNGLPFYNGTYLGTPYSGSLYSGSPIFTTLYRDNYDRSISGCAGEGCGQHAGVDIGVPSGTQVAASLSGTVKISSCDATFGGLVVIQAINPLRTSENIYLVYAHMKERVVNTGNSVAEGQLIGLSGGATTDVCHGSATGPHLHFQIDKNWAVGQTIPWVPGIGNTNTKDTSNRVPQYTYNPLVLLQGGYWWNFEEIGFKEYWKTYDASSNGVSGGSLWLDSSYFDAAIFRVPGDLTDTACSGGDGYRCSPEVTIEGSLYKIVHLNLEFSCPNTTSPVLVYFYFLREDGSWHGFSFNYTGPNWYGFSLASFPEWTGGLIKGFWVRTAQSCTASPGIPEYKVRDVYIH